MSDIQSSFARTLHGAAIIGMAGRFPGAGNVGEFWRNLRTGVESIDFFSDAELLAAGVDPETLRDPSYVKARSTLAGVDLFDAGFFGYTPHEAMHMDPQQRVFLETAWEALEDAGYDAARYPGAIGLFAGCYLDTYLLANLCTSREFIEGLLTFKRVGAFQTFLGNDKDYLTTRAAYKLGLKGPALTVQTACSTSLVAIATAFQSLMTCQSDIALAGGVTITFPQKKGYLYSEGGMLSPDGHCRAFDAKAQGTVFGSGIGLVVLKRVQDAVKDGDHIYAVVRGAALNNDGSEKVSYTAPSVNGQAEAILTAQTVAGVSPDTIGYVEAHGTGTPLGDPIEIAALTQAFRAGGAQGNQYCAIGSVKTNVGHLDVASGVAGLIKASLALHHGEIPPSLNYSAPNPRIDFASSPFFVNTELRPWPRGANERRAAVSSFGVGGTNAHVVLEESPVVTTSDPAMPWHVLPLSARSEPALVAAIARLRERIAESPELNLADVAFTLQVGRREFNHRRAFVVRDPADALAQLAPQPVDPRRVIGAVQEKRNPPVAFLFPGQGAQHLQMAAGIYETEPHFRAVIERCAEILEPELGCDLRQVIWPRGKTEAAEAQLRETRLAQPALFAVEYAMALLWMHWGVQPAALIGHSLGEWVAACVAGVFSLEDAARLVARRAALVQAQPRGVMLAVRLPETEVAALLPAELDIAAINAPKLCVVAGTDAAIAAFETRLQARHVAATRLNTSHAFHSALIAGAVTPFAAEVARVTRHAPKLPCISNVTGRWLTDEEATDPQYWASHLRRPVRFVDGLSTLLASHDAVLLEVGPGSTLTSLARQQPASGSERTLVASLETSAPCDRAALQSALGRLWLAGVTPDWTAVHGASCRRRVPLPTYPFERKRFFIDPPKPADPAEAFMPPPATIEPAPRPLTIQSNPIVPSLPMNPAPAFENPCRRDRIAQELAAIFHELAGVAIAADQHGATFLELGFDSLFLTQARQTLQAKFKVAISYRQLVESLSTIAALADYLDTQLPPDAAPPTVVAGAQAQPAGTESAVAAVSTVPATSAATGPAVANHDSLARLIEQQMQTMSQVFAQQLAALRSTPAAAAAPALSPPPAVAPTTIAPRTATVPAPPAPTASAATLPAKAHGPYRPPTKVRGETLTDAQREYLTAFIQRFTQRTGGSKRITQEIRRAVADPRSIANFRQLWKDLVYQIVIERADGAHLWDVDGNRYLDMTLGFGAQFLGHRPRMVEEALATQLTQGMAIGPQSPLTGEVAALLCELTGHERVSFCNTGSEAVMAAIRVARTVTGRPKIVYFNGDYHGLFDEVLLRPQPNTTPPRSVPVAPGIPAAVGENTWILDYGTPESLDFVREHGAEIAAVIVEPVQSRHPTLQPREFLRQLRTITRETGTLLVMDEIITGFRVHPGGAQGLFGVKGDMATYGKIVGGGLPIGVLAGSASCLDALDGGFWQFGDDTGPEADVTFFAGTFVRHPLTLAAARATLLHLKAQGPALQESLNQRTSGMAEKLNTFFAEAGVPFAIHHFSSQFRFHFPPEVPHATLLVFHLLERGIFIRETHQNCFLSTVHTDADIAEFITAVQEGVTDLQRAGFLPGTPCRPARAVVPRFATEPFPLTEAQREIWLACQLGPGASCAYNESFTLNLRGALDEAALRRALSDLTARHEALRLTFAADGTTQQVGPPLALEPRLEDWSGLDDIERRARAMSLAEDENGKPFDLARGPLARVRLCRLAPDEHLLVFTAHHLVCDGWSSGVILRDLSASYTAQLANRPAALPAPCLFSVFAQAEAAAANTPEAEATERYWLGEFRELPPPLELPTDFARVATDQNRCGIARMKLDPALCGQLRRAAAAHGSTLFNAMLAAFQVLMVRLSGQNEVVVGVFTAGQAEAEQENLVGHCVNMLPIRIAADIDVPFATLLQTTNRRMLDAREHGRFTYGRLVQRLKVPRVPGRPPLVSVIFNFERKGDAGLSFPGLQVAVDQNPHAFVNFDLFLNVREGGGEAVLDLEYNAALFAPTTARRWMGHFETLLRAIAQAPHAAVAELPLLTAAERAQLLREWNATGMTFPDTLCLHEVIERQVQATPEAIAVVDGTRRVTYATLDAQANRLAHQLQQQGIGPGDYVGICVPRTADLLVVLLGTLKAGAVYVPMDPAYPAERLGYIATDARLRLIVGDSPTRAVLERAAQETAVLCFDTTADETAAPPGAALKVTRSSAQPAYVIYTSGSTGQPKGVTISHRSAVSFVTWAETVYSHTELDGVLASTSICFDLSIFELFAPLAAGGKVILAQNALQLPQLPAANDVHLLNTVPSAAVELLRAGAIPASIETINLAGEPLTQELVDRLYALPHVKRVYDLYGPTECTTYATCALRTPNGVTTIGRPLANTQAYILDARQQPVPIGVVGEIYLGGEGVACGYLHRAELTAEKFVRPHFAEEAGTERVYRTGDRARFLPDGNIVFLGRNDHQVKIRGYRIELGEIEATLRRHPDTRECVVVGRTDASGHASLYAYIVAARPDRDPGMFWAWLHRSLPDYMVPSAFVLLDALPLTANGKIDHRALPAPHESMRADAPGVPPRTAAEELLADIWGEVLGVPALGVHDNFFELGGHSLMAMQVLSRVMARLQVEITLRDFLFAPTIARLASVVENALIHEIEMASPSDGSTAGVVKPSVT